MLALPKCSSLHCNWTASLPEDSRVFSLGILTLSRLKFAPWPIQIWCFYSNWSYTSTIGLSWFFMLPSPSFSPWPLYALKNWKTFVHYQVWLPVQETALTASGTQLSSADWENNSHRISPQCCWIFLNQRWLFNCSRKGYVSLWVIVESSFYPVWSCRH